MKGEIISINTARQSGKTYKMVLDLQNENERLKAELRRIKKDLELDADAPYEDVEKKIYDELYETINNQCNKILKLIERINKVREYCNNRMNYFNEMRRDYFEVHEEAETEIENILEILGDDNNAKDNK